MSKTKPASSYVIDWVVIVVRWISLAAIVLWRYINNLDWPWQIVAPLVCVAIGNAFAIAVVGYYRRVGVFRLVNLAGDALFAFLMVFQGYQNNVDLSLLGILPVITASLYYRWMGALLLAVSNYIVQGRLAIEHISPDAYIGVGLLSSVYLVVGLLISIAVQRLDERLGGGGHTAGSVSNLVEQERRRAIYDLVSKVSATLNYQRVLELALDLSAETLLALGSPANKMKSAALLFSSDDSKKSELHVATSRRFSRADKGVRIPGMRGLVRRVIETGQARLVKDVRRDSELSRFMALHECRSVYCTPLRAGLDNFGVLLFAHSDSDFFTPDLCEFLDIVANQAKIAMQNARLYKDLEQEKERMIEFQEDARKKIARDLHDGPVQSVAAIAMRVNFARRLMERDPAATTEELYKIEELARRTTKEIRHMLFTLRPLVLESQGLVTALESMAEKIFETYGQNVTIQAEQRISDEIDIAKQTIVFYIAEEAVNNARKHAQAENIIVRLKSLKNDLALLEVIDDGGGFDIEAVSDSYDDRGSLGLVNMRERAELINGVFQIESAEGRGTRVKCVIPLSEVASERLRNGY